MSTNTSLTHRINAVAWQAGGFGGTPKGHPAPPDLPTA